MTLWELATQAFDRLQDIKKRIEAIEVDMVAGKISQSIQDEYERLITDYDKGLVVTPHAKTIRLLKGFGFPESRFHDPMKNLLGWLADAWLLCAPAAH